MKTTKLTLLGSVCALTLALCGCGTTGNRAEHFPTRYRTTDGRVAEIGPRTAADGGWTFKEPHMDKCWIASDFDFTGYDTLLIAPTLSTVTPRDGEESILLTRAKQNLVIELRRLFRARDIFTNVVTSESEVPPGAHVLKLENTIIDLDKGSWNGRYWGGLFGGGQPVIKVAGKMTNGGKTVFTFEARRSGVSAATHVFVMPAEEIQIQDIRSMALDVTDFAAAIAGKYHPKN